MNAHELADDAKNIHNAIEALEFVQKAVPMLREQADRIAELEKDRDRLFKAHSAEMVRADKLQAELDNLYDHAPLDWENE